MPKRLPRARTLKGEPKLAYYDSGGGIPGEPAVVLVHASLYRSEDWENVFPRLATRYRVVAFDQRGHGKSGRASDYSLRALADDNLRVLRDIVRAPSVVVGHWLGALGALACAADASELVAGLVLEDPPLAYGTPWPQETYGSLRDALSSGDPTAVRKAVERLSLPSPGPRGERTYGEMRGFYASERVIAYFRDVDAAFIDRRIAGEDARPLIQSWLDRVRCPTLAIAGEPRLGSSFDDASEWRLKKSVRDLTVKRFPGTGHLIHGFRPEQFLENLEPFLRKLRSTAPAEA